MWVHHGLLLCHKLLCSRNKCFLACVLTLLIAPLDAAASEACYHNKPAVAMLHMQGLNNYDHNEAWSVCCGCHAPSSSSLSCTP
jgi:hypothetical protein